MTGGDHRDWLVMLDATGLACGGCQQHLAPDHRGLPMPTSLRLIEEIVRSHLSTCDTFLRYRAQDQDALCIGENVCDGCGWCPDCGRFVGTPHIANCACSGDTTHKLCRDCHAAFVAWTLTEGSSANHKGHWWDERVEIARAAIDAQADDQRRPLGAGHLQDQERGDERRTDVGEPDMSSSRAHMPSLAMNAEQKGHDSYSPTMTSPQDGHSYSSLGSSGSSSNAISKNIPATSEVRTTNVE